MAYDWHAESFAEFGFHAPSRTIYLEPDSDQFQFEHAIKGLTILAHENKKPITIVMNAPGGCEYSGLAVYDAIRACPAHVTIEAYGHRMSMGSWIMQAADERVLAPNCTMMIHYGTWGYEEAVTVQRALYVEMERLTTLMENTYLDVIREKHPRFERKELQSMLGDETYLTAQEAVALGLADRILE